MSDRIWMSIFGILCFCGAAAVFYYTVAGSLRTSIDLLSLIIDVTGWGVFGALIAISVVIGIFCAAGVACFMYRPPPNGNWRM